jgi:DNA polymerase III alpha subunit (gram-positive type)
MSTKRGPRLFTLDIETSPIVAHVWGLWKVNIGLNQIVKEWSIMSYCAKELGKKKVIYDDTSKMADPRDDSQLLIGLHALLCEADILITQNGKAFDMKKINARFIEAGMMPIPPIKIIDTMLIAKDVAKFTSNRLAWLSDHLTATVKSEHAAFPGMELWNECLLGNKKAWREMKRYNCIDVPATEELYLKLRPYMVGHPNLAAYYDDDVMRCPKCAGTNLTALAKPALTQTGEYTRYQCGGCGGFARSRYTVNSKAKRHSLLTN